jgi:hypothetical protein
MNTSQTEAFNNKKDSLLSFGVYEVSKYVLRDFVFILNLYISVLQIQLYFLTDSIVYRDMVHSKNTFLMCC